jgi:hypothetical protein
MKKNQKTTYKVIIREMRSQNDYLVSGQDEFTDLADACKKALEEMRRLVEDLGINDEPVDDKYVYLEVCKFIDGEIEPFSRNEFDKLPKALKDDFELHFDTNGWAMCDYYFNYSNH